MLVHIIGTRPQYIKAAVVISALKRAGANMLVVDTGQHYDPEMSAEIWMNFEMSPPDIVIQTAEYEKNDPYKISEGIITELSRKNISSVIVYGDTNSALAGAMAAMHLGLPLVHIEAGLRSFNQEMPEESNRIIIDQNSSVLFCPSETAKDNLLKEKIKGEIILCGDVMYDAFLFAGKRIRSASQPEIPVKGKYILLTIHRLQNTEDSKKLMHLLDAMNRAPHPVIWPVHPRIKNAKELLENRKNIHPLPPQDYFHMHQLIYHCEVVCTDSGGLQKEAYWAKKPCVTLREDTEWVETLHDNWNILAGDDKEKILNALRQVPDIGTWIPLYTGNPTEIIVSSLMKYEKEGFPVIK